MTPEAERTDMRNLSWRLEKIDRHYQWYRSNNSWNYEPITVTTKVADGRIDATAASEPQITVPVTYTQALRPGHPAGLESSEVTLAIARKIKAGHAAGVALTRIHRHTIVGTGTVLDRFRLPQVVAAARADAEVGHCGGQPPTETTSANVPSHRAATPAIIAAVVRRRLIAEPICRRAASGSSRLLSQPPGSPSWGTVPGECQSPRRGGSARR